MIREEKLMIVAKNKKGMEDIDFGRYESNDAEVFVMPFEEFDDLYSSGVFSEINKKCGLLIDDYECEEIFSDKIPAVIEAIKSVGEHRAKSFMKALRAALSYGTMIHLEF